MGGGPQLAIRLTKALRAQSGTDPAEADATARSFASALTSELNRNDPLVLRREGEFLQLGEERLRSRAPDQVSQLKDLREALDQRGVAALIFSGAWTLDAVYGLLDALGPPSSERELRVEAINAELEKLAPPARARALDSPALLKFLGEPSEPLLGPREHATWLYARLVALATTVHELPPGAPPDRYDAPTRSTLRALIDGWSEPAFARRVLAATLRRASATPRAYRAANVACFSIAMARELGLSRHQQFAVAYAGLFHDLPPTQCLRGKIRGEAGALRFLVSVEHGQKATPGDAQHPLTSLIAVADAFDRAEAEHTPLRALASLESSEGLSAPMIGVLRAALGVVPRGTVVRLAEGGVAVIVEGGTHAGCAPVLKHLVGPKLGQLEPLVPDAVTDSDVDPTEFGLKGWSIVLTEAPATQPTPGPAFSQPAASEPVALAARKLVDALQKSARTAIAHPSGDLARKQAILGLRRALDGAREAEALPLTLELRPKGIHVGDTQALAADRAEALLTPLRAGGLRRITIDSNAQAEDLDMFAEAMALAGAESDLLGHLWEAAPPAVRWHAHDPYSPTSLAKAANPLNEGLRAAIDAVRAELPAGLDDEDDFCASASTLEWTPADHAALLKLATQPIRPRLRQAVAWLEALTPPPSKVDVARFLASILRRALWRQGLNSALDFMDTLFGADDSLPPALVRELATPGTISDLIRRLREGGQTPDVGGGVAFLQPLGAEAVIPVCRAYAGLHLDEALRRLLATYLVDHVRDDPRPLVPLTLSRHPQVAREALILLGVGGPGSPGHCLLVEFTQDRSKPNRAARATVAQEILDTSGDKTNRAAILMGLTNDDKAVRLESAARLRGQDEEAFALLSTIVEEKSFANRDEDEVQLMLDALVMVGGGRATRVLEELASRNKTFALITTGTRRVGKAATTRLKALQRAPADAPTKRFRTADSDIHDAPTKRIVLPKRMPGGFASPAAAAKTAPESVIAWLCCPLFPPVPLGPKPVVEIGRGACDLRLIHESVSRRHAIIRIAGDQLTIEDRSSYGTWLNGERALTAPLKVGDVLTIGPFDVSLEANESKPSEHDTRPLRTFASSEAIGGRLERVSLAEVLQQIEFNEKTGTLEVFADDQNGTLVIYDGKPVYAEMGELRDDDAVIHMLAQERGNFSFRAKIEAGEMTMTNTLTGLLMEASRRIDEVSAQEAVADLEE